MRSKLSSLQATYGRLRSDYQAVLAAGRRGDSPSPQGSVGSVADELADEPLPPRAASPLAEPASPDAPDAPLPPPADATAAADAGDTAACSSFDDTAEQAGAEAHVARRLAGVSRKVELFVKKTREAALRQQQLRLQELVEQMGLSLAEVRAELTAQLTKRSHLELEIEEMRATWNPTPFLEQSFSEASKKAAVKKAAVRDQPMSAAATARRPLQRGVSAVLIERQASQSFAKVLSLCKEMGQESQRWDSPTATVAGGAALGESGVGGGVGGGGGGGGGGRPLSQGRLSPATHPRAISPTTVPRAEVAEIGVQTAGAPV